MSASVEKISRTKYQAWCEVCRDGINAKRQVDAYIWASAHNREKHSA